MGYRSLSCGRPAAEQRYILAMLRVFAQLPPERREAVRALIACLAETPEEGRALFGVLVQQKTLEAGSRGGGRLAPEALPPAEEISRADAPVNTKGGSE